MDPFSSTLYRSKLAGDIPLLWFYRTQTIINGIRASQFTFRQSMSSNRSRNRTTSKYRSQLKPGTARSKQPNSTDLEIPRIQSSRSNPKIMLNCSARIPLRRGFGCSNVDYPKRKTQFCRLRERKTINPTTISSRQTKRRILDVDLHHRINQPTKSIGKYRTSHG